MQTRRLVDLDQDVWFELDQFEHAPATANAALLRLTGHWGAANTRRLDQPSLVLTLGDERYILSFVPGGNANPLATSEGSHWQAGYSAPTALLAHPQVTFTLEVEGAVFALPELGTRAEPTSTTETETKGRGRFYERGGKGLDAGQALRNAQNRIQAAEREAKTYAESQARMEGELSQLRDEFARLQAEADEAERNRELAVGTLERRVHDEEARNRRLSQTLSMMDVEAAWVQTRLIEQERRYETAATSLEQMTARLEQVDGRAVDLDDAIAETERLVAPIEIERERAGELERELVEEREHRARLQAELDQAQKRVGSLESEAAVELGLRDTAEGRLADAHETIALLEDQVKNLGVERDEAIRVQSQAAGLLTSTGMRVDAVEELFWELDVGISEVGRHGLSLESRIADESDSLADLQEALGDLAVEIEAQAHRGVAAGRELAAVQARANAQQRELESALADAREDLAAAQTDIESLAKERDAAVAFGHGAEQHLESLQVRMDAFDSRLAVFHTRIANAETRAGLLDGLAADAEESLGALREMTEELAVQHETEAERASGLEDELRELRHDAVARQRELEEGAELTAELQEQIERSRQQLETRDVELARARADGETMQRRAEQSGDEAGALRTALDALTGQMEAQVEQTESVRVELASQAILGAALEEQLAEAHRSVQALEQDLVHARARAEELGVEVAGTCDELAGIREELLAVKDEAAQAEYKRDVATAAAADAAADLARLQQRAQEIDGEVAALDAAVAVVDGRAIELGQLVRKGDLEGAEQREMLDELDKDLYAAAARNAELEREVGEAAQALAAQLTELEDTRQREESLRAELEHTRVDLGGQLDVYRSRADELEAEIGEVRHQAGAWGAERDRALAALAEADDVIAPLQAGAAVLGQRVEALTDGVAATSEAAAKLDVRATEARQEMARQAADMEALALEVERGERRAAALESELAELVDLRSRLREVSASRDGLERDLRRALAEASELRDEVARLGDRLREAVETSGAAEPATSDAEIRALEHELRRRLADAEVAGEAQAEERARVERHLQRVERELQEAQARLVDDKPGMPSG